MSDFTMDNGAAQDPTSSFPNISVSNQYGFAASSAGGVPILFISNNQGNTIYIYSMNPTTYAWVSQGNYACFGSIVSGGNMCAISFQDSGFPQVVCYYLTSGSIIQVRFEYDTSQNSLNFLGDGEIGFPSGAQAIAALTFNVSQREIRVYTVASNVLTEWNAASNWNASGNWSNGQIMSGGQNQLYTGLAAIYIVSSGALCVYVEVDTGSQGYVAEASYTGSWAWTNNFANNTNRTNLTARTLLNSPGDTSSYKKLVAMINNSKQQATISTSVATAQASFSSPSQLSQCDQDSNIASFNYYSSASPTTVVPYLLYSLNGSLVCVPFPQQ